MIWAVISGGVVTNVINADREFVDAFHPGQAIPVTLGAGIGWAWDGEQFVAPPEALPEEEPPA